MLNQHNVVSQLIEMFTRVIGDWARLLIAIAALAVMVSTLLASLDACPRIADEVIKDIFPAMEDSKLNLQLLFLVSQVLISTLVLVLFLKSFRTFIDFTTSIAFLIAPVLAWFNHRAMCSAEIATEYQPGKLMRYWSLVGVLILFAVAACYLYLKLL